MTRERWIVVGTDFSDGAHDALDRAVGMAEDSGASVALVHAYEESPASELDDDPTPRLMGCLAEEISSCGAARRGVHVEPLVRRGPPWDKLLNVATEYGAEVVVVGGTGQRGTTPGVPLGSVAARVLALSTRCVLVARPRTRELFPV